MPLRPSFSKIGLGLGASVALLALAACNFTTPLGQLSRPTTPPAPSEVVQPQPQPSALSRAVQAHFLRTEAHLQSQGLMRRDGGGPDTPFGPRALADSFVRIALYDEYTLHGGSLIQQETPASLRRWQSPIRIGLRFGASVSPEDQANDQEVVIELARRLSRLSGNSIRLSEQNPNFWVYVVSEDERPHLAQEWASLFPGLEPSELQAATQMPLSTFCMVLAISEGSSPIYTGALAVVRAELGPRLRQSCFHEEITQGLGLANDYPLARPSIFNDDEEFATLTKMDELLVKILYDRRLRPGQTEAEVRPLLGPIIEELLPSGS